MPTTDTLITGAIKAVNGAKNGSFKTRHNQIKGAKRFAETLRQKGYGVKKWSNVTNKHVGAVVDLWKAQGLTTGTMKVYLSAVRVICELYGNDRIHKENKTFDIENRKYVTNENKSLPQSVYEKVVSELKNSDDNHFHRIAAQLQLGRELGLRGREARNFSSAGLQEDGRVFISHGTKGGRERVIIEPTKKAIDAIAYMNSLVGTKKLKPANMSDKQWEKKTYKVLQKYGISKKNSGASMHGLRHAYAQEKYEKITGFKAPCMFESKEKFRMNAEKIKGVKWLQLDRDARLFIKAEMGHGPKRDDVVSQYLGSSR